MALSLPSFRAAAVLLALASTVACSKKEDAVTPTPAATPTGWTVDGATVAAGTVVAGRRGNAITIAATTAANARGNAIALTVPSRPGTFTLGDTTVTGAFYNVVTPTDTITYFGTTGSVVVSAYTPSTTVGASTVTGTYNFTGVSIRPAGTKTITNGKFSTNF